MLVGAGGHAKAIAETIFDNGGVLDRYVDPKAASWLTATHIECDNEVSEDQDDIRLAIGLGGVTPEGLVRRLEIFDQYRKHGFKAPPVIHGDAIVSDSARCEPGTIILAGAVVQPGATLGRAAIINTRAVVEHDSLIDAGAHIGPGGIVLGGVTIGACAMIGAGAVILPGTNVPPEFLVPAGSVFPRTRSDKENERR